jgi:hypothetical protein
MLFAVLPEDPRVPDSDEEPSRPPQGPTMPPPIEEPPPARGPESEPT